MNPCVALPDWLMTFATPPAQDPPLEERISATAAELQTALREVLEGLPGVGEGPQALAQALGLTTVFGSRLLKAVRQHDPLAVAFHAPGPAPLRRFVRAARRRGVGAERVRRAVAAITEFETLVRQEAGDRSAFNALVSAWLPEARGAFEARRKQSVFKAMSELKGAAAERTLATVILHPSESGRSLDVVWLLGLYGLRRLRPGATVKLTSRRMGDEATSRRPRSLSGQSVEDLEGLRLDQFCQAAPAPMEVHKAGNRVHYLLGGEEVTPSGGVDLLLAEVNLEEIRRFVPRGSGRRGHFFAEVSTPCQAIVFDAMLHRDVYPGVRPELFLYDTTFEGVADVNDRSRDVDRLETSESVRELGAGIAPLRGTAVPRYTELLTQVHSALGWNPDEFRTWRVAIEYPLYGSQVTLAFAAPEDR